MQITIKTLTGRKQLFNFEDTDTVLTVKQQLQEKEGIQVDQIRQAKGEPAAISIVWCAISNLLNRNSRNLSTLIHRLIYSGKQLADESTLASYNVAAGSTIHMVLQLRGGR